MLSHYIFYCIYFQTVYFIMLFYFILFYCCLLNILFISLSLSRFHSRCIFISSFARSACNKNDSPLGINKVFWFWFWFSYTPAEHRCWLRRGSLSSAFMIMTLEKDIQLVTVIRIHMIPLKTLFQPSPSHDTHTLLIQFNHCCLSTQDQNTFTSKMLHQPPSGWTLNLSSFMLIFTAHYTTYNTWIHPFTLCTHIGITRQNSCWKHTNNFCGLGLGVVTFHMQTQHIKIRKDIWEFRHKSQNVS